MSFFDFVVKNAFGTQNIDMSQFKNKVTIVVNVASKCGYTKSNYSGLSKLLDEFSDKGLMVLCVPSNQFGKQEPGTAEDICTFADKYDERFIIAEKSKVNGSDALPLFEYLKKECPGVLINAIKWNFTKFLINKNGKPVSRFGPNEEPSVMRDKIVELLAE